LTRAPTSRRQRRDQCLPGHKLGTTTRGPRFCALPVNRRSEIAWARVRDNKGKEETVANLRVNGQERTYDGDPSMPLLWYLRDELALTGTKFGCGAALCGNCTVHVDGTAVRSCVTPMSTVTGKAVVTIEGLDPKGNHPVQVAWRDLGVPQCGYCQTGQIMQAASLLAKKPAPTDAEITEGMSGNLCRCGCYQRIHAAVRAAAKGA
jgi:isoquinoline 1-oxidoreductase subunit alpha